MRKYFYRLTQNEELRQNLPFYVNSYSSEFDQLYTVFNKGHSAHHLIYTLEGSGYVEIGGEKFELKIGDFFFYQAGIPVKYYKTEDVFVTRYVSFSGFGCKQLFEYYSIPKYALFKSSTLFTSLTKLCSFIDKSFSDEKTAGQLFPFIMDFCLTFSKNKMPQSFEKAVNFIKKNFHRDIPISELAETAGVSQSVLFKQFKDILGLTPVAYITSIRMDYAKNALKAHPNLPLKSIAPLAGFSSESYFIETFKKHEGITPSKYKKQNKLK